MKNYPLIFILFFLGSTYSLAQNKITEWGLNECFEYAVKNNISLKRSGLQVNLAELKYNQSKANKYPTSNFTTALGDQLGRSLNPVTYTFTLQQLLAQNYQLSGSTTLYSFNKLKNIVQLQELSSEATKLDYLRTLDEVKQKIIEYYFQILLAGEQIKISKLTLEQTQKQLEIAQKQLEAGTSSDLNIIQIKTRLISDSLNILSGKENEYNNLLNLKALLNLNDSTQFNIKKLDDTFISSDFFLNLTPEQMCRNAAKNLPQSKIDSIKIDLAVLNIKTARASCLPSLSLNYNLATAFSNYIRLNHFSNWWQGYGDQLKNNFNQQITLGLNIPLANNKRYNSEYRQTKIELEESQLIREQNNDELKKNIYSLHSSTSKALEKYKLSLKIAEGLEEAHKIYLRGYEEGGVRYLDLITSQDAWIKGKIDVINSKYDLLLKLKLLSLISNVQVPI